MTEEDLHQLEMALGVRLPEAYRAFLLHPPFTKDSGSWEDLWLDDAQGLIRDNKLFREHTDRKSKLQPPERYLVIGCNHSDSYFAIDLQGDAALPVLEVSFSPDREIHSTYASLDEFIRTEQQYDREAAEADAAAAFASPWPRRLILTAFIILCILYVVYETYHSA